MPSDDRPPESQSPQGQPSESQSPARRPAGPGQPSSHEVAKQETLARAQGHQPQRGPEAEARTDRQTQEQQEADVIRSGEAAIPTFLSVFFVIFGLWGIWYFAFHLAPLDQPEPLSVLEARPLVVRSAQDAAGDPANEARPTAFSPTGEFSVFALSGGTAQLRTGAALFQGRCAQCHGADGQGRVGVLEAATLQGDSLIWTLPPDRLAQLVHYGFAGLMPQWGDDQGRESLDAVTAYLNEVMAPAPGTNSPLDITRAGVNVGQPINTFTRPWEQADGELIEPDAPRKGDW